MTIFKHQRDRALLVIDEKKRALDVAKERIREHNAKRDPVYDSHGKPTVFASPAWFSQI